MEAIPSLEDLATAINSCQTKTKIIYISKYSAIPSFWLQGGSWVGKNMQRNLDSDDYLIFAGPSINSITFQCIAEKILLISEDKSHSKHEVVSLNFPGIKNISDLEQRYLKIGEIINQKGGKVIYLDDNALRAVSFNFSIIKKTKRTSNYLLSPWEIYFFDNERVFEGQKMINDMDIMDVLTEPEIFSSSNEALGNMMYYHALKIDQDIKLA